MKILDFLDRAIACPYEYLSKRHGIDDNYIFLLQSPVIGIARDLIRTREYSFSPQREHIAQGISLIKNLRDETQANIRFENRTPEREFTTDRSFKEDRTSLLHSEEQLRRFNASGVIYLYSEIAPSSQREISYHRLYLLMDIADCLIKAKKPFCFPHSLPEPVYFPDILDDEIRESIKNRMRQEPTK
jgi:hypothetical protein